MLFGILGPLQVTHDDGTDLPVVGARLRRLLTRLVANTGTDVSAAELVEALWADEPPANTANALQSLVSRLRRALGDAGLIQPGRSGYRLVAGPEDVDAMRFESLAARGTGALRAGQPDAAAAALDEAAALWRGDPLADADDAGYASGLRSRYDELLLGVRGGQCAVALERGRAAEVIAPLRELVAAHPLREGFAGPLMTALVATGRTAEALRVFLELRDRLADELGLEAIIGAVCAVTALDVHDVAVARRALEAAYGPAIGSHDRPIMASLALAVAAYALAVGRPADATDILAAAEVLRGSPDRGDRDVARVRRRLAELLGAEQFDERYRAGLTIGKPAAERRIDPALLPQVSPTTGAASRNATAAAGPAGRSDQARLR